MEVRQYPIKIKDIIRMDENGRPVGYKDLSAQDLGITGMDGKLNIRPPYQREFVYKVKERNAVINTIIKVGALALGCFWFSINEDGTLELMDGQQRTVSTCQWVNGDFSIDGKYFHSLPKDEQERILNQDLDVKLFIGTDTEKLEWFRTINIAGKPLFEQELRNAAYVGPWLFDAKRYFSKTGGPAYQKAGKYLKGEAIRQDYLETAIRWKVNSNDDEKINEYMSKHQFDENAEELWNYFVDVINWVKKTFKNFRKEMCGVEWGFLYNKFKDAVVDPDEIEEQVAQLMQDEDVTNVKGIYEYVLDGDERHLSIRAFDDKQKRIAFEKQHGYCPRCYKLHLIGYGHKFTNPSQMQGDHMTSHKHGGRTTQSNLVMLCPDCNSDKSGSDEVYTDEFIAAMIKDLEGENNGQE